MILFKYLGSERCSEKHVPHSAVGSGDDPFIRNDSSATEVVQFSTVHQGHHPRVFIHFRLNSAHDTGGSVHKPTIGCGYGMESQLNGESTCEWDSTFTSMCGILTCHLRHGHTVTQCLPCCLKLQPVVATP